MDINIKRLHSILLCVLSIFVNLCTSQLIQGVDCTTQDGIALLGCASPLVNELRDGCDVECSVLQRFADCANDAEVTESCIDSIDAALAYLTDTVDDCSLDAVNAIIDRCYPNGLDSAIIKPVWTDKEMTSCSVECGEGTQTWTRKCVSDKDPSVTRKGCSGVSSGTEKCQINCTQPDGIVWTEWSDYSECSVTCGDGNKARQRQCVNETHPAVSVEGCLGVATETEPCSLKKCNPSEGIMVRACFLLSLFIPILAGVLL